MPGYLKTLSDWDLLDIAEGLRRPTTLEEEMAIRLRRLLESEREQIFNHKKEQEA